MKAFVNVMFLGVSSRDSSSKTYFNVDCKANDGLYSISTRTPDKFKGINDGEMINLELNVFNYKGSWVVSAVDAQVLRSK